MNKIKKVIVVTNIQNNYRIQLLNEIKRKLREAKIRFKVIMGVIKFYKQFLLLKMKIRVVIQSFI